MRIAFMQQSGAAVLRAALAVVVLAGPLCQAQTTAPASGAGSALSVPQDQLIQPESLKQLLQGKAKDQVLVFQVGSHLMYAEAHIPGSKYAGPGAQATGLDLLVKATSTLAKQQPIVLYCGCCPWNRCPNVGPAYQRLHQMGFTNVKVLYLADNFGANWVDKGYPLERGR